MARFSGRQTQGMPSVFDNLSSWVHKTSSSFALLRPHDDYRETESAMEGSSLIFRLRQWPDLPPHYKTADVYRALSMMSTRPVNRRWFVANSGLPGPAADRLMRLLIQDGAVDAIDPTGMPADR